MNESAYLLPPNPNDGMCYLPERLQSIVLAAGSFWSAQAFFSRVRGVAECQAGYVNGRYRNVSFKEVDRGNTGFAFAIRILYDPDIVRLEQLLDVFFSVIDPVAKGHQGYDWGYQYRTGVYYTEEHDLKLIKAAFERCREKHADRITVELVRLDNFVPAEEEQQNYLDKHPETYRSLDFSLLDKSSGHVDIEEAIEAPLV